MKTYLVISQRNPSFATGFNPEQLERVLNLYAGLGWELVSCSIGVIPRGVSYYTTFLAIMERSI